MPAYQLILFCLLSLVFRPVFALNSEDILPPDQVFKLTVTGQSRQQLELEWQIEPGYHLYRDKTKIESQTDGIQIGAFQMPEGAVEHDAVFGDMSVYRDRLKLTVPIINPQNLPQAKLLVKYQGCADIGVCYPPQKKRLEVALPESFPTAPASAVNQFFGGLKKLTPSLFTDELLPPEQAFQFFATLKDDHTVHVSWLIADGYYLYKHKLGLTLAESTRTQLAKLPLPPGETHLDEEFGQVEVYRNELSLDVPLQRQSLAAESVELTAKFQGCADRGVCYPPMTSKVVLQLPATEALVPVIESEQDAASEQDRIVNALKSDSLVLTLISFFGFGVLLSLTPCVFPMIPILSGIIVGHGHHISTRKAFLLSASFVLASALMYTVFGILAALFGSNLQAAFQEPWVIATFAGMFVLLSLSMFGFYNLQIPAGLQSKLHHSSDRHRDGSYWGAGVMGALSSLIVGPCVAAPLAAALIYIGQTGDVVLGGSALFAMGLGMGLPLLLVGASAGKLLPKAGEWMNATKAVFGVVMLAVAVWMLSRILPATVIMLLSAMLLIIPAIYLNAIEPLPQPSSGWKKLWKGLGLMMLLFGVLQLIGLSAGNTNPLQPLAGLAVGGEVQAKEGIQFKRVRGIAELEQTLQQAKANQQWVMLDFYADWCVSCKEMEAYTFTDTQVKQQLQNFVLIQADVTENNDEDKALLQRFNLVGPPGIIFFDPAGQERSNKRVIGYQDAATFVNSLKQL
ncbi:protein-disulfide reductase DsbD [Methylomonas methanica]|uniref:Thiol:disulfide interchange protein DsbD n=1 Tax=Methylomonas methanica (strain DSM 25384 / MC09) TaxID=857087 RepID=G0A2H8_METMM|nr:protein-disulfide reductase DsbD [Methylomonas methanica]AEG00158.1 Thiol:disulfide interchange protein dsbD [Methylomonas methanica MC09]